MRVPSEVDPRRPPAGDRNVRLLPVARHHGAIVAELERLARRVSIMLPTRSTAMITFAPAGSDDEITLAEQG
ncbi:hypothetical protein OPKNFCMD_6836 [Methylobacterium crusticola]|uniref:Uncharacterized protein n=1 Tax=Methylobacterium crusticola TaxID=1697972 RepID=A0ABQ4RB07_9HYPH|nr:hypothetical protein OPKNFCMD_6836 [Methylobacterium crusticola]